MGARRRSPAEAVARCPHAWMREVLQRFAGTIAGAGADVAAVLLGSAL